MVSTIEYQKTIQNNRLKAAQHFLSVVAGLVLALEQKSGSGRTRLQCDFLYCFFFLCNGKVPCKTGCH